MDLALVALCGVLGLVFGSFANVVIHRVPAGESIVHPPSACPRCGHTIAARDNVPVVSWLLLGGRCRHCSRPISRQYPAVELLMAGLFAAAGARIGLDWALPAFLLFVWLLTVVAVIDVHTRKIPNRLIYPLTPTLLVLLVAAAVLSGEPGRTVAALGGGLAGFGALLLLAFIQPRGMGMGDVKLAGFIGLGLGYLGGLLMVALGVFGGFLLGGVVAVVLVATGLRRRRDQIPFGPYLSAGALLTLYLGEPVVEAYLGSMGLR